jgi:hypothetical protein
MDEWEIKNLGGNTVEFIGQFEHNGDFTHIYGGPEVQEALVLLAGKKWKITCVLLEEENEIFKVD